MTQLQETCSGIVINSLPFQESDIILHVLTPSHGRVAFIVKHAKKSKKRFASPPEVLDRGQFEFRKGKGSLFFLLGFIPFAQLKTLRLNLDKLSCACVLCQAFDYLLKEGDHDSTGLYEALDSSLLAIDLAESSKQSFRVVCYALTSLLKLSGFFAFTDPPAPSAHSLFMLIDKVEQAAERELSAKEALLEILRKMPKDTGLTG